MKLNRTQIIIISSVVIALILTLTSMFVLLPKEPTTYKKHDPIVIWNDRDFKDYNFPGSGTKLNPYLIQNYIIEPGGPHTACIFISGTTKYFVIQNCKLESSVSINLGPGIIIEELRNCAVKILDNEFTDIGNCLKLENTGSSTVELTIERNIFNVTQISFGNPIYLSGFPNLIYKQNKIIEGEQKVLNVPFFGENIIGSKGVDIWHSPNSTISDNEFGYLHIAMSQNCVIENNLLENSALMRIFESNSCFINNNIFEKSWISYSGLAFADSSHCTVTNNQFTNGGIIFAGLYGPHWSDFFYQTIVENNTVNSKKIGMFYNLNRKVYSSSDYGQMLFFNCTDIAVSNQMISKVGVGIGVYSCDNFTFTNSNCYDIDIGLKAIDSTDIVIKQNSFVNTTTGIDIQACNNSSIYNNSISGQSESYKYQSNAEGWVKLYNASTFGINLDTSHNSSITSNSIIEKNNGIISMNSNYLSISINIVKNISIGVSIQESFYANLTENYITSCSTEALYDIHGEYPAGILLEDVINTTIENNILEGRDCVIRQESLDDYISCVALNNTVNGKKLGYLVNQENLTISSPIYSQLYLINCSDSLIANQEFRHVNLGFHIGYCDNLEIRNITSEYNSIGLSIMRLNNSTIEDNFFIDSYCNFLFVTNSTIENNEFDVGLSLSFGRYNDILNNSCGRLTLDYSYNCTIMFNLFELQGAEILIIYHGHSNVIHHNAFINLEDPQENVSLAWDANTVLGFVNTWYDELLQEGNFWSNYSGTGTYEIAGPAGSEDLYPLSTNPIST